MPYITKNKPVEIEVESDYAITPKVYEIVFESLLKYILYHYQQVPIPIDILEKEIKRFEDEGLSKAAPMEVKSCQSSESNLKENETRTYLYQKGLEKRKELERRSYERKRQRWIPKVKNMLKTYNTILDILKDEVKHHMIRSIIFAIGPSPLTPKYAFRIHAPNDPLSSYATAERLPSATDAKESSSALNRRILLALFRSFTSSKDFESMSTAPVAASRLWTFFEKEVEGGEEGTTSRADVLPRHDFKMPARAKVVHVYLSETKPFGAPNGMDLTPCVGACRGRDRLAGSAVTEKTKKRFPFSSCEGAPAGRDSLGVEFLDEEEDGGSGKTFLAPFPFTSARGTPWCQTLGEEDRVGTDMVVPSCPETPSHLSFSAGLEEMEETPVVGRLRVQRLSRGGVLEFRLSPEREVTPPQGMQCSTWFQVEHSIHGFKDVYLDSR